MKIIKENLFVVILLAVVVVGAGVSLVLAGSYDRTRDKELQERKGLGDQLSSQERQKINERKVKLAESRVKRMKEMVETATAQTSLRSRHDYKVLDFAVGAKSVAAFPVDPSVGDRNELRLKFPKRYREQALAMLAAMRPAEAPSEKDIKDALDKLQGITSGDSTRGATRNPYDDEAIRRPYHTGRVPEHGPGVTPGAETQPALTPEQLKVQELIRDHSLNGWVYADEDSMYIPLKVNGQYNEDELWMAQVSLWVQSDILRAIQQTVQEGLRSGSLELKGVPASPVKRLVYIRVPGYVMKRTGMTGGGAGAPAGPVSPAAPTGVGAMQYVGGLGTLALTGTGQGQDPPHLTARACNTLHDVVHYQFRVLMPERHLLSLYRNLMLQNYHTILDVNVSQPLKGSAAGGATGRDMVGGSQGRSEEFYDYGTDPVVQVTITGELLLLADFTRGRIDPGVKGPEVGFSKDFPPLMPPLFLDRMNLADPSALRKEDGDRMRAAGLGVTPAAGPTPYGQPRRPAGEEPPIRRGGGMEAY